MLLCAEEFVTINHRPTLLLHRRELMLPPSTERRKIEREFAAGTEMPRGGGSAAHVLRHCLAAEGGGRGRTIGKFRSLRFFESQQGRERPYESLSTAIAIAPLLVAADQEARDGGGCRLLLAVAACWLMLG
nr:hypothetical protein Iba_chr10eCG13130 [Ipomoea batatas]